MIDPVTRYEYPDSWITPCMPQDQIELVAQGLGVLTASGKVLRRGYTTGTTAAAACKAAILSLQKPVRSVSITTPCGIRVHVPVSAENGEAECRKISGDYPGDVTADILITAMAVQQEQGIDLEPGKGIGRFTRATPRYAKGTPAISPAPLSCILQSMEEALNTIGLPGIRVRLEVPDGEVVAAKTLNSRIGVEGGISILGTTGFVEPWDDHLAVSAFERIAHARNAVLTTGRVGLRYARLRFPENEIVLIGSRIGDALSAARHNVILFGLPALVLKYIRPDILEGTGYNTVEELSVSKKFSALLTEILLEFRKDHPEVHVIIIDRNGNTIGESP